MLVTAVSIFITKYFFQIEQKWRLSLNADYWESLLNETYFFENSEQKEVELQLQALGHLFSLLHTQVSDRLELATLFTLIINLLAYSADIVDGFKAVKLAILYLMLESSEQ